MRKLLMLGGITFLLLMSGCAQTNSTININGNNNNVTVQQVATKQPGYTRGYYRGGYYYPRYYRTYRSYSGYYGYGVTPGYRDGYGFYHRGGRYNNGRHYASPRGVSRRTARRTSRRSNGRH